MNPHYPQVAVRAGHRCEYCHAPEAVFNFPFEVEHILPSGQGGSDSAANWALACRACNLHKSSLTSARDAESGDVVGLFDPREEHWQDHFAAVLHEGTIVGRTPKGRATVEALHMNSPAQVAARQHWIRLGLFP